MNIKYQITGLKTKATNADFFRVEVRGSTDTTSYLNLLSSGNCQAVKINPLDTEWNQATIITLAFNNSASPTVNSFTTGTTYFFRAGVEYKGVTKFGSFFSYTPTGVEISSTLQNFAFNVGYSTTFTIVIDPILTTTTFITNVSPTFPTAINSINITYTTDGNPPTNPPALSPATFSTNYFPSGVSIEFETNETSSKTYGIYTRAIDINGQIYDWKYVGSYTSTMTGSAPSTPPLPAPGYPSPIHGGRNNYED